VQAHWKYKNGPLANANNYSFKFNKGEPMMDNIDFRTCPQCNDQAMYRQDIRTQSEQVICYLCGYTYERILVIDPETDEPIMKEDGTCEFIERESNGYGGFYIPKGKGGAELGCFKDPLSEKDLKQFDRKMKSKNVETEESFLSQWDEKSQQVISIRGKAENPFYRPGPTLDGGENSGHEKPMATLIQGRFTETNQLIINPPPEDDCCEVCRRHVRKPVPYDQHPLGLESYIIGNNIVPYITEDKKLCKNFRLFFEEIVQASWECQECFRLTNDEVIASKDKFESMKN